MRSTNNYYRRDETVVFSGDVKGGTEVICPSGFILIIPDGNDYDKPLYDPLTGKEIFYPGWAEW